MLFKAAILAYLVLNMKPLEIDGSMITKFKAKSKTKSQRISGSFFTDCEPGCQALLGSPNACKQCAVPSTW